MLIIEINKVLKNIYFLLVMIFVFSVVIVGILMVMNLFYFMGLVFSLIVFGVFFVVNKKVDSVLGVVWVFVFIGLMGVGFGFMFNYYVVMLNGLMLIM